MKWLLNLVERFRRESLLGLSRNDIKRVRDNIVCLFLAPGEYVKAPPPRGFFGVSEIEIGCSSSIPYFKWTEDSVVYVAWLKVPPMKAWRNKRNPCWDLLVGVSADKQTEVEGIAPAIPFNDKKVRICAALTRHLAEYFPFVSTNNYVQNQGAFIA